VTGCRSALPALCSQLPARHSHERQPVSISEPGDIESGSEDEHTIVRSGRQVGPAEVLSFCRAATCCPLSITNKIAEGSGSLSAADFANFLNTSRRSVFEVANILMILSTQGYLDAAECKPLLGELSEQRRMILGFIRNLRS
jgi:four helix bundle protein